MREYATFNCSIWDDDDFLALTAGAQRTYFMLTSQRELTACGLLAITMRRWSKMCADPDTEAWLDELLRTRFVVIDWDSEEVFVRTFMRYDQGYKHAIRLKAVRASLAAIRSHSIATLAASELARLLDPSAYQEPPESLSSATQEPVESQRSGLSNTEVPPLRTTTPHSTLLTPVAQPGEPAAKRGKRIPDDWTPSRNVIDQMRGDGIPDALARRELPRFRDFWRAKPGKDGVKLDWDATWRNWLRRAHEERPISAVHDQPGIGAPTTKSAGWLALDVPESR